MIRTITIGGNALSQNISDSLGITFEKAEKLKKGYFAQEITLTEDDPSIGIIQSASNQFLARTSQEITRSIVTYKRLKKGKAPQKIYLTGRGALLPNLAQYLIESQQLQVEYFDPLSSVQIGSDISERIKPLLPFMISEAVGLSRTLFDKNTDAPTGLSTTINLLPSSKLKSLGLKKKLPIFAFSLFILCFLPLPSIIKHSNLEKELLDKKDKLKSEVRLLESKISEKNYYTRRYYFSQNIVSVINKSHQPLLDKFKISWVIQDTINFIQGIITQEDIGDIWLDSFALNRPDKAVFGSSPKVSSEDLTLFISGRYLVRLDEDIKEDQIQDTLIELDRQKKENLTNYLSKLPRIDKIEKKLFQLKEKGIYLIATFLISNTRLS